MAALSGPAEWHVKKAPSLPGAKRSTHIAPSNEPDNASYPMPGRVRLKGFRNDADTEATQFRQLVESHKSTILPGSGISLCSASHINVKNRSPPRFFVVCRPSPPADSHVHASVPLIIPPIVQKVFCKSSICGIIKLCGGHLSGSMKSYLDRTASASRGTTSPSFPSR